MYIQNVFIRYMSDCDESTNINETASASRQGLPNPPKAGRCWLVCCFLTLALLFKKEIDEVVSFFFNMHFLSDYLTMRCARAKATRGTLGMNACICSFSLLPVGCYHG